MSSRTAKALRWLERDPKRTAYAAAQLYGLSYSVVHRAIHARKGRPRCPTCGQILRK